MDNEVPMYTYHALQDSEKQITNVMNSVLGLDKLSASAFLKNSGKLVRLSSESLQNRQYRITFSHFDFRIDPTQEDACLQRYPFCFQFSLRLPHQHFDTVNNKVEDIISPYKQKNHQSARKAEVSSTTIGGGSQLFSTPLITVTRSNQTYGSSKTYLPEPLAAP